jgi:hypothetical protein
VRVDIAGQDGRHYYLRANDNSAPAYSFDDEFLPFSGEGVLRIREVRPAGKDMIEIEATLETPEERLTVNRDDLIWFGLKIGGTLLDCYAQPEVGIPLAPCDVRVRTFPQKCRGQVSALLMSQERTTFSQVRFRILRALSTPRDLSALGALAVRTLLVGEKLGSRIALDETQSLARRVAKSHTPDVPLAARLQEILGAEAHWLDQLGPHRLLRDGISRRQALESFPFELWIEMLAFLVRIFPQRGPDSICDSYGLPPGKELASVFDEPITALESFTYRAQAALFGLWPFHREVKSVIDRLLNETE